MGRRSNWLKKIVGSSDFVLLLIGAGLTSLLIPYLFDQWQAYQKELEIKTDLVQSISESAVDALASLQLLEGWTRGEVSLGDPDRDLITEFLAWQKNSAKVGSELTAYFPQYQLRQEWDKFDNAVFDFFVLYEQNSTAKRKGIIENIYANLSIDIDNSTLEELAQRNNTVSYRTTWNSLKDEILNKSNMIIDNILRSPISVYRGLFQ